MLSLKIDHEYFKNEIMKAPIVNNLIVRSEKLKIQSANYINQLI